MELTAGEDIGSHMSDERACHAVQFRTMNILLRRLWDSSAINRGGRRTYELRDENPPGYVVNSPSPRQDHIAMFYCECLYILYNDTANKVMNGSAAEMRDEAENEELLSAMEELHIFRTLLVSGCLTGKHPPGFLSKFRALPDEILLKIWSFLPKGQLRSLRQVSKHWKVLWESSKHPKYAISHMSIGVENGKFVVGARGRHRLTNRRLEVEMNAASLDSFFSLVTFGRKGGNELSLEGGAATAMLLENILSKKWTFAGIVFMGDLSSLTEDDLCLFLSDICKRSRVEVSLRFLDVIVDEGVITDRVVIACGKKLCKLVIMLDSECAKKKPVVLTDQSLPFVIRDGLESVIPDVSAFTTGSIEKAITDAISEVPEIPDGIDISENIITWSESKLVYPKSTGFPIRRFALLQLPPALGQKSKTFFRESYDQNAPSNENFAHMEGGFVVFTSDPEYYLSHKTFTVCVADAEHMSELRRRFAPLKTALWMRGDQDCSDDGAFYNYYSDNCFRDSESCDDWFGDDVFY